MFVTDPSDLGASPLGVSYGYNPNRYNYYPSYPPVLFGLNSAAASNVTLAFPFTNFPATFTGGMLCTVASASGCGTLSGVVIAPADMSPSLLASSGGLPITAQFTTATVTMVTSSQGSNSVYGYSVDSTTGALTLLPSSPFAAGLNPTLLVVDPSNKFVYVANQGSNNVSGFAVNSTTGALTVVPGSPFAAGTTPHSMAVDSSGKFVYVANKGSNNVSAYTIDSLTGTLTPISGSPFAAGNTPVSITIDPVTHFVYVMNSNMSPLIDGNSGMSEFSINSATDALIPFAGSPFENRPGPLAATIGPSGKFLFQIFYFGVTWGVGTWGVGSSTGGWTPLAVDGDVFPGALAVHPSGKFLYVTDVAFALDYIVAYTVDTGTGRLTLIPGSAADDYGSWIVASGPYATGAAPNSIIVDPSGKFVYVGNTGSNDVSAYSINPTTGGLTPIFGSPFLAGVGPSSIGIVSGPASVAFDTFKMKVNIDEDRKTSFRVEGFFTLGKGNDGIDPVTQDVHFQVGTFSVTVPAGSFRERGRREFEFDERVNDVEVRMRIYHVKGKDYLFIAHGKGNILKGIKNPVTVGLTIGDDQGTETVKADIEK